MTPQEIYEQAVIEAEHQNSTAMRIQAKQVLADAMIRQAINLFNATHAAHLQAMWHAALHRHIDTTKP